MAFMLKHLSLCKALGYEFKNPELLQQALSHRSVGKQSNERLEFLGDSALNFIVARELFQRYPALAEGELSRLRANLVNGELLAELARNMELGQYIRLGAGEIKSGGWQRNSILADTLEAVIGAICLDSDIEVCRELILKWLGNKLDEAVAVGYKDPKTKLQEWLQNHKMQLPIYKVIKMEGVPHSQIFHVECLVNGLSYKAVGVGTTKRKAEQNAADLFLKQL